MKDAEIEKALALVESYVYEKTKQKSKDSIRQPK
jgi:hypothetical protein